MSGAVSVFQDVTENKTVENELIQMENSLWLPTGSRTPEIRNPMTTLKVFANPLPGVSARFKGV